MKVMDKIDEVSLRDEDSRIDSVNEVVSSAENYDYSRPRNIVKVKRMI